MATKDRNFIEVVITINNEGKEVASKLYCQQYFFVAQTPVFMKNYGLRGESFTISEKILTIICPKKYGNNCQLP